MKEKISPKEILLVDDDPDYKFIIKTRLEKAGFQVHAVSNGKEAIKILETMSPDLIIMDLEMPDRNGLTTIINLNAGNKRKEIPIIVATGVQSQKVKEILMDQRINGYLNKPYESEQLIEMIKHLIGGEEKVCSK